MRNRKFELSRREALQVMAAASLSIGLPGLRGSPALAAGKHSSEAWNQGDLVHLIPLVNHHQVLIKASFRLPLKSKPWLHLDDSRVAGQMTDTEGRFWQFHATGLTPDHRYELQLQSEEGRRLADSWPLRTFPEPGAMPERLRILAFTCAGGNEDIVTEDGTRFFLSLAERHRLLDRGLSLDPDVVISNGDHIYWDQMTIRNKPGPFSEAWLKIYREYGSLDPGLSVLGTANEAILKRIADPQIARLYGVRLRSVPTFMLTDDHDLFENDEASEQFVTLPPSQSRLEAARATQHLYYPEFLPDQDRPDDLAGSSQADRLPGLSEVYGSLRYGRLFEALLYDTKRYCTTEGDKAVMFPRAVEAWLAERTGTEETRHLMHIPSTPLGWSAGKWGEWYPDVRQSDGNLGKETPKPFWPSGWWLQHQRLLKMLHAQQRRSPVIASGDLHALAYGEIIKSGDLDFSGNPVHSMCVGPLGTAGPGFPSQYRGIESQVPVDLQMDERLKPTERNGFTVFDVIPDKLIVNMYSWLPEDSIEAIDTLEPCFSYEIRNRA